MESVAVPAWIPATPEAVVSLQGQLPAGVSGCHASALASVLACMRSGAPFTQLLRVTSAAGAQGPLVRKRILMRLVADQNDEASGKLYWGEPHDLSLSPNRCLPLESIREFYLGAQSAVLKEAFESHQADAVARGLPASSVSDECFISLLSDQAMLGLEAPSVRMLCYWLWGLCALIFSAGRDVSETRDATASSAAEACAAQQALNASRERLNQSLDASALASQHAVVSSEEMDLLRQNMLADEAAVAKIKRHTRKFSVAWAPIHRRSSVAGAPTAAAAAAAASNLSMQGNNLLDCSQMLSTSMHDSSFSAASSSPVSSRGLGRAEAAALRKPLQALRSTLSSTREGVAAELASMSSFIASSFASLGAAAQRASSHSQNLVASLAAEQRKRKLLQNKLIELQGNIRVFVRVRPTSEREQAAGEDGGIDCTVGENMVAVRDGTSSASKAFEFDRVFGQTSTQEQVFADVAPFVQSAVDGFNICCFAYGQTGAGKSYTMEGPASDRGVNYRALGELFALTDPANPRRTAGYTYAVTLSVVEIYNETIRDLLHADQKNRPKLDIRHGPEGNYIPDLTELTVGSVAEVRSLLSQRAYPNRSVTATGMNEHSSRSHCVLFVKVVGKSAPNASGNVEKTTGKLILIDLAGSERVDKSKVAGAALKEASAINASLAELGNVISALQAKASHVPYRNSKLTYLLQDCLSGQSKCLMFCQLSPCVSSVPESLCSLAFASRARSTDLGQAKKNKGVAQAVASINAATSAAAAAAAAEAKKDAAVAAKATRAKQAEQEAKGAKELAQAREQIAALQAQLKAAALEAQTARTQAAQQAQTAAITLAQREREWKDAQAKAVADAASKARRAGAQAWAEPASIRPATARGGAAAKVVPVPAPVAADMEDVESEQENAPVPARAAAGSKKRKSAELSLEEQAGGATKKLAGLGQQQQQPQSRIVAPSIIASAATGAQTARTRRQQAVQSIAEKSAAVLANAPTQQRPATTRVQRSAAASPSPSLLSPTGRSRPATAGITPSGHSALSFNATPSSRIEAPLSEEGWDSHAVCATGDSGAAYVDAEAVARGMAAQAGPVVSAPAGSTATTTGALSVVEQARRKMEERKAKYGTRAADGKKAAVAGAIAAAANGGWKR